MVWSGDAITVSGAVDAANATAIGRRMRALLTPGDVVADCRAVTFIDVAGCRMLAELGLAALAVGAVVCLRCSPAVTRALDVCGIRDLPGVVIDRDDTTGPGGP